MKNNLRALCCLFPLLLLLGFCPRSILTATEVKILKEPWTIQVKEGNKTATFEVPAPDWVTVADEKVVSFPIFNVKGPAWSCAYRLPNVIASECTVCGALDMASVKLRLDPNKDQWLTANKDYQFNNWGCIGRIEGGVIPENATVYISYRSVKMRIDSIVLNKDGSIVYSLGTPHVAIPAPPKIDADQKRIANIWISGPIEKLNDDLIFGIEEPLKKNDGANSVLLAKQLVPKTWKKLVSGEEVKILAWGDSVTDAGYLPEQDRWQHQFATRLRQAFPKAKITMLTEAWGGRNSDTYRNEPKGSPKNYKEKVLDLKPDLIVSEFVNDSGMNEDRVQLRYGEMLKDFQGIGAEWIILTPHYVRPDWMGLTSNKNIDNDPRPYVAGLRKFTKENNIALADASILYGHLWREGIPYLTLMCNNINHPNRKGMKLFADSLMDLFGENKK